MTALPLDQLCTFAFGIDHAEGICLAPDGFLYVGGELGQLYRIESDERLTEVARTGGFALGVTSDGDSRIYMCDQAKHCVWRIDSRTGAMDVFTAGLPESPLRTPNAGCFAEDGTYYVTDSGGWKDADGVIWRVDLQGQSTIWSTEVPHFPNGMCMSPDSRTLFVLESTPPALIALDILPDGAAGPRRVVSELPNTVPDGIALAEDGRFVIACYRPDSVFVVDDRGRIEVIAEDPEGTILASPTNLVFAGANHDEIVVPNLGRWHLTKFSVPGLRGAKVLYPSFI